MPGIVVADPGPLIGLARGGYLPLLQELYQEILIPSAVHSEVCLESERPGSKQPTDAKKQGWLQTRKFSVSSASYLAGLALILDEGEAEAILLAEEMNCWFLLIDERKARAVAVRRGIPVAGVAGVLLAAMKRGLIDSVLSVINRFESQGYRLSDALIREIARLAQADDEK